VGEAGARLVVCAEDAGLDRGVVRDQAWTALTALATVAANRAGSAAGSGATCPAGGSSHRTKPAKWSTSTAVQATHVRRGNRRAPAGRRRSPPPCWVNAAGHPR
jgi:hypothetical protein